MSNIGLTESQVARNSGPWQTYSTGSFWQDINTPVDYKNRRKTAAFQGLINRANERGNNRLKRMQELKLNYDDYDRPSNYDELTPEQKQAFSDYVKEYGGLFSHPDNESAMRRAYNRGDYRRANIYRNTPQKKEYSGDGSLLTDPNLDKRSNEEKPEVQEVEDSQTKERVENNERKSTQPKRKKRDDELTTAELYQKVTGRNWKHVKGDGRYGDMYDGSFERNMSIRKDLLNRLKNGEQDNTESYSQNRARDSFMRSSFDDMSRAQEIPSSRPGEDLPDMPIRRKEPSISEENNKRKKRGLRGFFRG